MYRLLFKQFLRTNTCKIGLFLVLTLGVISIAIGRQFLHKQDKIVDQVTEKQLEHIERNVSLQKDNINLLLYYLKFAVINKTDPLAALSIGQKDVNPSVQRVGILTLEAQKYDTDLLNPVKLLYGNLDLSFILVYVFPLLIIAFTYNLRSEEEETGTWRLVNVMAKSPLHFLFAKLSIRIILLFGLMSLLFVLAGIALGIPWNGAFQLFFFTSLLYVLFWFALSFWVITLKRNSSFNALALLSVWLLLVILLPAALNNMVATQHPVPEALTTMIKQRDGYHLKWDVDKRETMDKFYALYPQFKSYGYDTPKEGFDWFWYYAMQHLGDEESAEESALMRTKVLQREQMSRRWGQFIPSIHTQLAFNDLANSSLSNHMYFLAHLDDFHERTRLFFYPKVYEKVDVNTVDWSQFRPEFFQLDNNFNWKYTLLPLIISILVLSSLSVLNIRNTN